jgi:hypothetical protein
VEQFQSLGRFLNPESLTLVGGLVSLFVGWKLVSKLWGFTVGLVKKASFIGLVSAVMAVGGVSTAGFGVGESIRWGSAKETAVSTDNPSVLPDNTLSKGMGLAGAGIASCVTAIVAFANRKQYS